MTCLDGSPFSNSRVTHLAGQHFFHINTVTHPARSTRSRRDIRDFKIQRRGRQGERQKKTIDLISKTTTLQVHHAFLYISFLFLHDYDVKMPNLAFYGGRKQATTKLSELGYGPLKFSFSRVRLHLTKWVGRNNRY